MLTPEKLSSYEFNKVVEIYNQLNIDISSDIIRRIEKMGDITESSKYQIKKLVQLNGKEIFNKALLETAKLDANTVSALKSIYEDMAKVDIQGFKEIYDYRDKPFKLTASQYQILNEGVKSTNKELKNFTKSIAFNSQQLYINAVDKAYNKVVTGAFDYNTAIKQAYKEVAEQGIVLQDSAGRNVKLDVAVRRNVLSGIQSTANNMNRDVEDYLGTDGYEVTAHLGARDTHAVAQGKQYALTESNAKKYGIGLWNKVKDLWDEFNCRHTYFGVILGISEPSYSNGELNTFINEEVSYNGVKIPIYEATQMQRNIERNIRNAKRELATLEKANQDTSNAKTKLKKFQKEYTNFTNETGLIKQNERVAISKGNNKNGLTLEDKIKNNQKEKEKYEKLAEETFQKINPYAKEGELNKLYKDYNEKVLQLHKDGLDLKATSNNDLDKNKELRDYIVDYTNGKYYTACEYTKKIANGMSKEEAANYMFKSKDVITTNEEISNEIIKINKLINVIDNQKISNQELVRIQKSSIGLDEYERGSTQYQYKTGEKINWGIKSTTKDLNFVEKVSNGKDAISLNGSFTSDDIVEITEFKIIGSKKKLDIEKYSVYDQNESLIKGNFIVEKVENYMPKTVYNETKKTFDTYLQENNYTYEKRTAKSGKEMITIYDKDNNRIIDKTVDGFIYSAEEFTYSGNYKLDDVLNGKIAYKIEKEINEEETTTGVPRQIVTIRQVLE